MNNPACLGDIEDYGTGDGCDSCSQIDNCTDEMFARNSRETLKAYFGFSEEELDEYKPNASKTLAPRAHAGVISAARQHMVVRKRRAELTDEEKAETARMSKEEFERWLGARRTQKHRSKVEEPIPLVIPAKIDIQAELAWRKPALVAWVSAQKGRDMFARSLAHAVSQKKVLVAWVLYARCREREGREPTLQMFADELSGHLKRSTTRQGADRLLKKIVKLETNGGPWCQSNDCPDQEGENM